MEIITVLYSVCFLITKINEMMIQKIVVYFETILQKLSKAFFIISLICVLLIVPMRLTCNTYGEDILCVLAIISMSIYFIYFAR